MLIRNVNKIMYSEHTPQKLHLISTKRPSCIVVAVLKLDSHPDHNKVPDLRPIPFLKSNHTT